MGANTYPVGILSNGGCDHDFSRDMLVAIHCILLISCVSQLCKRGSGASYRDDNSRNAYDLNTDKTVPDNDNCLPWPLSLVTYARDLGLVRFRRTTAG
jgi:hypothetical protein